MNKNYFLTVIVCWALSSVCLAEDGIKDKVLNVVIVKESTKKSNKAIRVHNREGRAVYCRILVNGDFYRVRLNPGELSRPFVEPQIEYRLECNMVVDKG